MILPISFIRLKSIVWIFNIYFYFFKCNHHHQYSWYICHYLSIIRVILRVNSNPLLFNRRMETMEFKFQWFGPHYRIEIREILVTKTISVFFFKVCTSEQFCSFFSLSFSLFRCNSLEFSFPSFSLQPITAHMLANYVPKPLLQNLGICSMIFSPFVQILL